MDLNGPKLDRRLPCRRPLGRAEWLLEPYRFMGCDNYPYRQAKATRGMLESVPCAGFGIEEVQRLVSEVVDYLDTTELWLNLRQT